MGTPNSYYESFDEAENSPANLKTGMGSYIQDSLRELS